ncbi:MAG: site-specific integrase [Candidatus Thiodiazotropha sp. (ex Lucinoma borealis)]|nr:site-specific integrase [Candidatus Thiodiazotropha sp. (ex Lucinoma borealis)]
MASIRKRTKQNGSTSYRVDVRLKGFPPQRATFSRLTDAKKWAGQTEAAIREGRYFRTTEARKHTLADAIDRYKESVLPAKKDGRKQKAQLDWWRGELGAYTLADVTPALLGESRDKLSKDRAPATVVRYLAALSHVFTVAINEWGWLEDSPVRKVRKPQEPRGRVRFLSEDEMGPNGDVIEGERSRLLRACKQSGNPHLHTIVVLALSTGMRQGEILNLHWSDVDLKLGRIILHETKNGERRVVPLLGFARELLEEHSKVRRLDTDLLFPGRNPKRPVFIRSPWLEAVKKSEIEDLRFHDLRHSAASYMLMTGASLGEIAELLGHKTLQMVKRYSHLSEPHAAGVVGRMNQRIFGDEA